MAFKAIGTIAKWFIEHDDGEFALRTIQAGYLTSGSDSQTERILYSTKPQSLVSRLNRAAISLPIAIIGGYGLPTDKDIDRLRNLATGRTLTFLGDADPPDLLIFALLRSHVPMTYLGTGDSLIATLGGVWDDRMSISLAESESLAMRLLAETCPDYRSLLGPQCTQLLESGKKLELEGAMNLWNGDRSSLVRAFSF